MEAIAPNWRERAAALGWDLEDEWLEHFVFPSRGRKAVVGKWIIAEGAIKQVSFLPVLINKFSQPRLFSGGEEQFDEISKYVQELCQAAKLDTRFTQGAEEVIIHTLQDKSARRDMDNRTQAGAKHPIGQGDRRTGKRECTLNLQSFRRTTQRAATCR